MWVHLDGPVTMMNREVLITFWGWSHYIFWLNPFNGNKWNNVQNMRLLRLLQTLSCWLGQSQGPWLYSQSVGYFTTLSCSISNPLIWPNSKYFPWYSLSGALRWLHTIINTFSNFDGNMSVVVAVRRWNIMLLLMWLKCNVWDADEDGAGAVADRQLWAPEHRRSREWGQLRSMREKKSKMVKAISRWSWSNNRVITVAKFL